MRLAKFMGALVLAAVPSTLMAGDLQVTPALRDRAQAACTSDAMALCAQAIGDEAQLVSCMKTKRADLSAPCGAVYDEVARVLKRGRQS